MLRERAERNPREHLEDLRKMMIKSYRQTWTKRTNTICISWAPDGAKKISIFNRPGSPACRATGGDLIQGQQWSCHTQIRIPSSSGTVCGDNLLSNRNNWIWDLFYLFQPTLRNGTLSPLISCMSTPPNLSQHMLLKRIQVIFIIHWPVNDVCLTHHLIKPVLNSGVGPPPLLGTWLIILKIV